MKKLTSLHLTPTLKTPHNISLPVNIPLPSHPFVFRATEKNINIIFELLFISHRTQIILKFYFTFYDCKTEYCRTGGFRIKIFHDILYIASFTCLINYLCRCAKVVDHLAP